MTPSLMPAACAGSAKASEPMNRLAGEADPGEQADAVKAVQDSPSGRRHQPSLTAAQHAAKTPTCLPMKSPTAMPMGKGATRSLADTSANDTPALAKAKIGMMAKLTQGCSMLEVAQRAVGGVAARHDMATATPASVAWMLDLRTATQMATPTRR